MARGSPLRRAGTVDRLRLDALRHAVNEEAAQYIAVMRVLTDGSAGLLSDLSVAEVADRLDGPDLEVDTVDTRLGYLVERGDLARSPCETEARSIREYLNTRTRYQLTQRGAPARPDPRTRLTRLSGRGCAVLAGRCWRE